MQEFPEAERQSGWWPERNGLPSGAVDPLAHSLVGAALAETGLRRTTAFATPTLIIGANLPDIDAFAALAGQDTSLLLRRGLTHGAVALVLLPWLLAGGMYLWGRRRLRGGAPHAPPARFGVLLLLAYVGVLSHPLLDWLNTYGVRLLKPFSDQWFYGDTLFIIDPWMWLLAGCAVVLARSRTRLGAGAWALLAAATTLLVLLSGEAPVWARVVWCVALIAILLARVVGGSELPTPRIAQTTLALLALYVVLMVIGSRTAESRAAAWARGRGSVVENVVANPLPARPWQREVIIVTPERYLFFELSLLNDEALRQSDPPMPRLDARDPIVAAALEVPSIRGFRNWMRLPSARTEALADGHRVFLYDVRYARSGAEAEGGIGRAVVELDRSLQVR